MPSWDEEFSDPELLSDLVDSDYAPDVCEDLDFNGLAVDFPHLCRVHKLVTKKCVAFGGSDTGRRFFMCSVENAPNWLTYDFPADVRDKLNARWGSNWKGQAQKWFLFRLTGSDDEINLMGDGSEKPEFSEWTWMTPKQVIEKAVEFKKPVYEETLKHFAPYLQSDPTTSS